MLEKHVAQFVVSIRPAVALACVAAVCKQQGVHMPSELLS